jgi:hypothetical protein
LWEGLFAEEVAELWEPWMRVVDELLEDEALTRLVLPEERSIETLLMRPLGAT